MHVLIYIYIYIYARNYVYLSVAVGLDRLMKNSHKIVCHTMSHNSIVFTFLGCFYFHSQYFYIRNTINYFGYYKVSCSNKSHRYRICWHWYLHEDYAQNLTNQRFHNLSYVWINMFISLMYIICNTSTNDNDSTNEITWYRFKAHQNLLV